LTTCFFFGAAAAGVGATHDRNFSAALTFVIGVAVAGGAGVATTMGAPVGRR
jgi:hypothetical protein